MKIAMIGQKGIPATYGGIGRHVEEIAARLVERGHKVDVFSRFYYSKQGGPHRGIGNIRLPSCGSASRIRPTVAILQITANIHQPTTPFSVISVKGV